MKYLLASLLLLVGCGEVIYGGDSGASTTAPRVDQAFPGTESQYLPESGSILFSASGADDDSLQLEWQWELGGVEQDWGESDTGSFDTSWVLDWSAVLSGQSTEVRFAVYDENMGTELFWPVTIE